MTTLWLKQLWFSLQALTLIGIVISSGCLRGKPKDETEQDKIKTAAELAEVEILAKLVPGTFETANQGDSIAFVHVDWSPLKDRRAHFFRFAREYRRTASPSTVIRFLFIDGTSESAIQYETLRKLDGWSSLEMSKGRALVHGWGEIIWMSKGRVLDVEAIDIGKPIEEYIHKANELFKHEDEPSEKALPN